MDRDRAELRDFYEVEAKCGSRDSLGSRRVDLRQRFIATLGAESRDSVIDFGAGPGLDGGAFGAAGFTFIGVDLAYGNGLLAARNDVVVMQGSVTSLAVRAAAFDAGWSMSVLMHLDDKSAALAVAEMARVLRPQAVMVIGVWGSEVEELAVDDVKFPGSRRPFYLRSVERNRGLLSDRFRIEDSQVWESASKDSDYQIFWLRRSSRL